MARAIIDAESSRPAIFKGDSPIMSKLDGPEQIIPPGTHYQPNGWIIFALIALIVSVVFGGSSQNISTRTLNGPSQGGYSQAHHYSHHHR